MVAGHLPTVKIAGLGLGLELGLGDFPRRQLL